MLVYYDPQEISTAVLLKHFFRMHNPSSLNRQGNDRGTQYRSAVFYHGADQKMEIDARIKFLVEQGRYTNIVTEITEFKNFYKAEEYHQDYLTKNPGGYCHVNLNLLDEPIGEQ